ncbi:MULTISPECIES: nitrogenase-stabilizing/protective protein NifW [Protofrankia]|uniref:Nitrogenase-stabilizing/protective protein NifW n=1 Tax=Candidatus Protofrankia californiensis TaxID=1839754 RepID=A0A1C3P4K9_9ACTN|nr:MULTISPECIES: nitrogenase-stabilizing/protective protein NifW [Protofrankia]SBW24764.1 nitrogenase-stabilizing/protective protein nifW [Candidatus Protofrankia californiensis]
MTTGTERLAQFRRCGTAEDYFQALDVPFDPRVVAVNRLHILRHFSPAVARIDAENSSPEDRLAAYRAALVASYEAFTTATALDHRLFKVLADRAPQAFVAVDTVTVEAEKSA